MPHVDVYVTNKAIHGKTLAELAQRPTARGVFLRTITRGATATTIPVLPSTRIYRGDILTLVERAEQSIAADDAAEMERKMREEGFDLGDFLEQLRMVKKMGPLSGVLGMLPKNKLRAQRAKKLRIYLDDKGLQRHAGQKPQAVAF